MNNLEYLMTNDKPALLYVMGNPNNGVSCKDCLTFDFCHGAGSDIDGCAETRAAWLFREYVNPDSWEQIEADVMKTSGEYWGCCKVENCSACPSLIDGEKPADHYGVSWCNEAMGLDVVTRCKRLALEGAF